MEPLTLLAVLMIVSMAYLLVSRQPEPAGSIIAAVLLVLSIGWLIR